MRSHLLRNFGTAFLMVLIISDISVAQKELQDLSSRVTEAKVLNNTLSEDTAEQTSSSEHHDGTNLDDTFSSKDKLEEQAELITSGRKSTGNPEDSSDDITEEIFTLTSVVTSRSILIHEKPGATHVPLLLDNSKVLVLKEIPPTHTTEEGLIDIDEEVIKEIDNTEDMSELLGEELPTKIVDGQEQEITPSMEEIFQQQHEDVQNIGNENNDDKMGIIGEWIKQIEHKEEAPQLNVITNEENSTEADAHLEPPKETANIPDNNETVIRSNKESSTIQLKIEETPEQASSTSSAETSITDSMTSIVQVTLVTASPEITTDIKSQSTDSTSSIIDASVQGKFTSPITKTTTDVTPILIEEDNLKVVPLVDRGFEEENVKFTSATIKTTTASTEIFVSKLEESTDLTDRILEIPSEDSAETKLVDIVDDIKEEIQKEKEELEYFEGLIKATTIVPPVFTSKITDGEDYLKVVPLEATTESGSATVVFTTKLVLTGVLDRVNDADLTFPTSIPDITKYVDTTTQSNNLEGEINIVPLGRGQVDEEMNIDVIIDNDKEADLISSKNAAIIDVESKTPRNLVFHHQTLDQTSSTSSTSEPFVSSLKIKEKPKRPLSITELVKQALEGKQETFVNGEAIRNDSREVVESISNVDYDYESQEKPIKPVQSTQFVGHTPSKERADAFQLQVQGIVPSIEAIDYESNEEDFPPFISKDISHPRIFNDGFGKDDQTFEESQRIPVIIKVPAATTNSYRTLQEGRLQDVIAQAVMKGINAVKTKMEQVRSQVVRPLEDYENDADKKQDEIFEEVLVNKKEGNVPKKHVVEDLAYDSAETDKELLEIQKEIEMDRRLTLIHRDLYFDEDLASCLSVNFSMMLTINSMDFFIPSDVDVHANNSESTVYMQLTWQSNHTFKNSLVFKLDKGEDTLQINGIFLDLHLTTLDGTIEHLQYERSWMNIVEWSQGQFEIKLGQANVLHIAYMDLVLHENSETHGEDSATFEQKLTSGTSLLIIAVTFGSSVTAFALGYLIYLKCRSKANVFKVDLP